MVLEERGARSSLGRSDELVGGHSWTILAIQGVAVLRRTMRLRYHTAPCRPEREAMLRFLRTSAPIGGPPHEAALTATTSASTTSRSSSR